MILVMIILSADLNAPMHKVCADVFFSSSRRLRQLGLQNQTEPFCVRPILEFPAVNVNSRNPGHFELSCGGDVLF